MQNKSLCPEVLGELRKIIRAMDIHSKKLAQTIGLTSPQIVVLKELIKVERVTVSVLAKNATLSHATVTSILDRLEKNECIKRIRDMEDKRQIYVQATEKGKQLVSNTPVLLQAHFIAQFEQLQNWEQSLILSSLQRIVSMMDIQKIELS